MAKRNKERKGSNSSQSKPSNSSKNANANTLAANLSNQANTSLAQDGSNAAPQTNLDPSNPNLAANHTQSSEQPSSNSLAPSDAAVKQQPNGVQAMQNVESNNTTEPKTTTSETVSSSNAKGSAAQGSASEGSVQQVSAPSETAAVVLKGETSSKNLEPDALIVDQSKIDSSNFDAKLAASLTSKNVDTNAQPESGATLTVSAGSAVDSKAVVDVAAAATATPANPADEATPASTAAAPAPASETSPDSPDTQAAAATPVAPVSEEPTTPINSTATTDSNAPAVTTETSAQSSAETVIKTNEATDGATSGATSAAATSGAAESPSAATTVTAATAEKATTSATSAETAATVAQDSSQAHGSASTQEKSTDTQATGTLTIHEAQLHQVFSSPDEIGELAEGTDISALMADAMPKAKVPNGASIMNDAVLSSDGRIAIMGLENLRNPKKPKVNTHIIIGANNEKIISPIPDEDEKPDIPTPPRNPATYAAALAAFKAQKEEEAKREEQRKKDKEKAEADGKRVLNHTSKSLDDFDFGHERSKDATMGGAAVNSPNIPKETSLTSGMGNGVVSNILDNKAPYAGRENQPHEQFGSTVSDFDELHLSPAEVARSRMRQALEKDNDDYAREQEREMLKQRANERRERERQEQERREQEALRLEMERFEQEKERRRQERLAQEQLQAIEQERMQQPEQNLEGDAYVALNSEGEVTNYNQPYATYADASEYDGIAAPVTENTPSYPNYDTTGVPAMLPEDLNKQDDSVPTYMVGNINRPQKEIVHTAMFVQGDGEEPSPYVCGVNARRISDSDLIKFQQQSGSTNPSNTQGVSGVSGVGAGVGMSTGNGADAELVPQGIAGGDKAYPPSSPYYGADPNAAPDGLNQNAFNQEGFSQDGFNRGGFNHDGFNQGQMPVGMDAETRSLLESVPPEKIAHVSMADLKLQPGFGNNLNFNNAQLDSNVAPAVQPVQADGMYPEGYPAEGNIPNAAEGDGNIYWTPGQSTADFQASRANQQRRMQQPSMEQMDYANPSLGAGATAGGAGAMINSEAAQGNFADEDERTGPLPTGMGDGALSLNGSLEQQNLSVAAGIEGSTTPQNTGPRYMVGPSRPTNQRSAQEKEEDEGPLYAVGPQRLNAKVEAKLQADRMRMSSRMASNNTANMQQAPAEPELDDAEQAAYEKALAEAARESVAAPQSEVIKRARQLAAQVSDPSHKSGNSHAEHNASSVEPETPRTTFVTDPEHDEFIDGQSLDTMDNSNFAESGNFAGNGATNFDYDNAPQSGFKSTLNAELESNQNLALESPLLKANTIPEFNQEYPAEVENEAPKSFSKERIGFGIMSALYIRQLCASFFTHTTLPILFPHVARSLGPCYPSSMAVPFFFVGLISALCGRILAAISPWNDGSGLTFLIYLSLTGLAAYRGIYRIGAYLGRRRRDVVLIAASVCVPMTCFIWLTNNLFTSTIGIVEPTLAFAFASMLSAAAASTLSWNVQQDPIDSCGSMSTKGLLLVIVVCFMAAFGLLHYIVGFSVLGVTFIMRLIFGFMIVKNNGTAHRSYINALQLITFFAILLDLSLLKGQNYDLLSTSTLELVKYIELKFF